MLGGTERDTPRWSGGLIRLTRCGRLPAARLVLSSQCQCPARAPACVQIYYSGAEIIPSALVLYILRKLPPKRQQQGYQQIPAQ